MSNIGNWVALASVIVTGAVSLYSSYALISIEDIKQTYAIELKLQEHKLISSLKRCEKIEVKIDQLANNLISFDSSEKIYTEKQQLARNNIFAFSAQHLLTKDEKVLLNMTIEDESDDTDFEKSIAYITVLTVAYENCITRPLNRT